MPRVKRSVAARKKRGLATYLVAATILVAIGSGLYTFGGSQVRSLSPLFFGSKLLQ